MINFIIVFPVILLLPIIFFFRWGILRWKDTSKSYQAKKAVWYSIISGGSWTVILLIIVISKLIGRATLMLEMILFIPLAVIISIVSIVSIVNAKTTGMARLDKNHSDNELK